MTVSLFYQSPTLLNREQHAKLKLKPNGLDFTFARSVNSVPLAVAEFADAARAMPIFFVEPAEGEPFPLALLGMRTGENKFVDAKGRWHGSYIPAFVRRYPFVLTEDDSVCFDEAYKGFNEKDGEPLFDKDSKDSPFLSNTVAFLAQYKVEMQRTQAFCKRLSELNLLKAWTIQFVDDAKAPQVIDGLAVVDIKKLNQLPDETALSLFRSGELGLIYAHLMSLGSVPALGNAAAGA